MMGIAKMMGGMHVTPPNQHQSYNTKPHGGKPKYNSNQSDN